MSESAAAEGLRYDMLTKILRIIMLLDVDRYNQLRIWGNIVPGPHPSDHGIKKIKWYTHKK